uniref:Zinc-finger domain-containing protein n=1 Tax=Timspurckia oligopyrenoides TaxID=708627 RepID=A0A7S1EUM2_9RHOD|mmetsp:Transcript_9988/g.17988  ORF Transcript_9988/g.17988 Transcript_9988/m.17988 type:complete len:419 (+) Transcript_9988:275-1531(+)|eukprot:CAMPEP_0182446740 /NCGR_PEP_ID=MMETSP1172-20130603/5496_1 /TAXON_ID=708627 /ORGANISM="Timspurckia oligopyrenoides, Strain CCMP3278" /LENGTH=418 /DNA_ID=CAMNT_0024642771 /DNA_START=241 /DNA_END=1497 /DNA_ORIENTATION=-
MSLNFFGSWKRQHSGDQHGVATTQPIVSPQPVEPTAPLRFEPPVYSSRFEDRQSSEHLKTFSSRDVDRFGSTDRVGSVPSINRQITPGKSLRIADLLNSQDEDDYALPMEDEDGPSSASGLNWGGYQDVSRGVPSGPHRGGGFVLPPFSSMGTSDFSTPISDSRSPRSNIVDGFSKLNVERSDGPHSFAYGSRGLPPLPGRDGGDEPLSSTSRDVRDPYGPSSKNSRTLPIKKKSLRSSASTTSRAFERAALVASLPSPKDTPVDFQSDFGDFGRNGSDRRTSGNSQDYEAEVGSGGKALVKKCYVGAKASQFCHVCRRSNNAEFASCKNLTLGSCRKVVCDRCFARFGWGWDNYVADPSKWECPHCTDNCPPKASCHLYSRINSNRLTKREREMLMSAKSSPGGSRDFIQLQPRTSE